MLHIKEIKCPLQNIEYMAFLNPDYVNIVSNISTDLVFSISLGNAGFIKFDEYGILLEVELFWPNPILSVSNV